MDNDRTTTVLTNQEAVPLEKPHDLRTYFAPVRLHRWLILAMAVVGFVGGWVFGGVGETSYSSTTETLVGPGIVSATSPSTDATNISMPTELEVMTSRAVAQIARRTLGSDETLDDLRARLSVTFGVGSTVLVSTFSDSTPEAARDGAQAFAEAYLTYKARPLQADLDQRIADLQAQITSLENEFDSLSSQLEDVTQQGAALEIQAQLQLLQQRITQTQAELQAKSALEVDAGTVIAGATLPEESAGGGRMTQILYGGVGLILFLMVGLVIAYLLESMRGAPHGIDDLEELLGAPVLGPVHDAGRRRGRGGPILLEAGGDGPLLQDFRAIGAVLLVAARETGAVRFLVTSSAPQDGRTTVAANLAVSLATSETRVILVSADLHAPRLEQLLNVTPSSDLVDHLEGRASVDEVIVPTREVGLSLVPGGAVDVQRRGDLLASDAMSALLSALGERAEVVIVDAPPLVVSDPLTLASQVDGIVHVVDARRAKRRRLVRAAAALEQAGGPIVGSVVNRFDPKRVWVGASQYRHESRQQRKYLSANGRSATTGSSASPTTVG